MDPPALAAIVRFTHKGECVRSTCVLFSSYKEAQEYAIQFAKDRAERLLESALVYEKYGQKLPPDDSFLIEVLTAVELSRGGSRGG